MTGRLESRQFKFSEDLGTGTTYWAVTLEQMLRALTFAVENLVQGKRVMGVPEIRVAIA